ncbi:unnamed protein product [Thelazia callipaeda]|uniref:N-acylethanolamine-hydrolyzing acid amidase n=1 Tax=Thelazia callipaeda TaxID=103827 RepID=A0A0N5CYD7_THECL|nr:unnamed protein product [Thelazia callipaeda]
MLLQFLCYAFYCILSATAFNNLPKQYEVNLNVQPEDRWDEVIADHIPYLSQINEKINTYYKYPFDGFLCWLSEKIALSFPEEYIREMTGIANKSGIQFCHIIGLNILYDITNYNKLISNGLGCTSIVTEDINGRILHGRNLDYGMTDLMKNLSILVHFKKNNEIAYSALTFAFFAGVTTGQRPNAFTLSLNARKTGWYVFTILMEIYTSFKSPIGFALRQTLEQSRNYDEALNRLSEIHFVAPSYLILAGMRSGEGAIIVRDRWGVADVLTINKTRGQWYIVQTNYDRGDQEDQRRHVAEEILDHLGSSSINEESLLRVLNTYPINNKYDFIHSIPTHRINLSLRLSPL